MNTSLLLERVKSFDWKKHEARVRELAQKKPILVGIAAVAVLLLINLLSMDRSEKIRLVEKGASIDFQKGRILNDRESTFYYGKERLLSERAKAMFEGQAKLEAKIAELEKKLESAGGVTQAKPSDSAQVPGSEGVGLQSSVAGSTPNQSELQLYDAPPGIEATVVSAVSSKRRFTLGGSSKGPDLIAFPVKSVVQPEGVVLPAGSYVKAKVLTGVDVPEGKTYPVLMVLDYSYVTPNDQKIDLSGCFMIAKAEGDLSTERVQMQATKMSCVSKRGRMFERDVNGFVADDKDGSFAMKGKVNSRQGRVASMAFLAGVVEGVGKAIQATQTTQSMNPLGGSSSVLTGDAGKYAVAGGASNAAGMVAQWYLQQAQSLAPTVEVGSGRDVWIVMKDKVNLPEEFFRKERSSGNESIYSYVTRVLE